jgi:hypothetical protein
LTTPATSNVRGRLGGGGVNVPTITCAGFTPSEKNGVAKLADRIALELEQCANEGVKSQKELDEKRVALTVLLEALKTK